MGEVNRMVELILEKENASVCLLSAQKCFLGLPILGRQLIIQSPSCIALIPAWYTNPLPYVPGEPLVCS